MEGCEHSKVIKFVEVPKVVEVEQIVEKIVEVPKLVENTIERLVMVPKVEERVEEVYVDKPEVQIVYKIVEVPKVVERIVERVIEVPKEVVDWRIIEVPKIIERPVIAPDASEPASAIERPGAAPKGMCCGGMRADAGRTRGGGRPGPPSEGFGVVEEHVVPKKVEHVAESLLELVETPSDFKPGTRIVSLHNTIWRRDEDISSSILNQVGAGQEVEVVGVGTGRIHVRLVDDPKVSGWASIHNKDVGALWGLSHRRQGHCFHGVRCIPNSSRGPAVSAARPARS